MIETGHQSSEMQSRMLSQGVAIGRSFPALPTMIRVSIGTDAEMAKFRHVLFELMST
jgi:histidinol-phosphate/aromatic aminotransferase/cobyric acid decarboxylase-like protein